MVAKELNNVSLVEKSDGCFEVDAIDYSYHQHIDDF